MDRALQVKFLMHRIRFDQHKWLVINELKRYNPATDGAEEALYKQVL